MSDQIDQWDGFVFTSWNTNSHTCFESDVTVQAEHTYGERVSRVCTGSLLVVLSVNHSKCSYLARWREKTFRDWQVIRWTRCQDSVTSQAAENQLRHDERGQNVQWVSTTWFSFRASRESNSLKCRSSWVFPHSSRVSLEFFLHLLLLPALSIQSLALLYGFLCLPAKILGYFFTPRILSFVPCAEVAQAPILQQRSTHHHSQMTMFQTHWKRIRTVQQQPSFSAKGDPICAFFLLGLSPPTEQTNRTALPEWECRMWRQADWRVHWRGGNFLPSFVSQSATADRFEWAAPLHNRQPRTKNKAIRSSPWRLFWSPASCPGRNLSLVRPPGFDPGAEHSDCRHRNWVHYWTTHHLRPTNPTTATPPKITGCEQQGDGPAELKDKQHSFCFLFGCYPFRNCWTADFQMDIKQDA